MADQDDVLHLIDDTGAAPEASSARKWKVAVIDDDQAVHEGTRFALSDYNLNGQGLEILSAYSAAEGQELMRALRARLSGLATPAYMLDIPGGRGKVPIGPQWIRSSDAGEHVVTDPLGAQHVYADRLSAER